MMQFNILEFLYDYFLFFIYAAIGCIIFVLAFTGWIIKHQIGTKVLIVRKTTAQIISSKENLGDGTVKIGKKMYKRSGDPVFMSSLLRPYRMYLHQEGSDKVISLAQFIKGSIEEDEEGITNQAFQNLLESQVIEQSVRGLVGTMMEKLIYMCAGGSIFIIVWEILRGIFGG